MKRIVRRRINIRILLITMLLLAAATVLLVYAFVHEVHNSVDISDYIEFGYTGVNGNGILSYEVKQDELYAAMSQNEKNAVVLKNMEKLIGGIRVEPSKNSRLTNGEYIQIRIEYDNALADKIGCNIRRTHYSVMVDGLGTGSVIDAFADVEVVVAGISPKAYANVINRSQNEYLKNVAYTIDRQTGIRLGDVITVTCEADDTELANRGVYLLSRTKEYKVDRVSAYVTETGQLDMNVLKKLADEAAGTIVTETEDLTFRMLYKASRDSAYLFQYNNEWVENTLLVDACFLYRMNESGDGVQNYVYLFFKSAISNGSSTMDVYFAFEFQDCVLSPDGAFSIAAGDMKTRYICGMDMSEVYGRVVLSKENTYNIFKINNMRS